MFGKNFIIFKMETLTISEVKEEFLEQSFEIERQNYSPHWTRDYILFNIKLPQNLRKFFVAKLENLIVGYIICWLSEETAHIHNIAVRKEYQNQGIGKKILEYLIENLKLDGIKSIVLEVRKNNKRAISLYKKFSFKEVSIKPKFYPDGEDAIFMIKNL